MSVHSYHPAIGEQGLADDCERCDEIARDPFANLDEDNLRALVERTQNWMKIRDEGGQGRSDNEWAAMQVVREAMRTAHTLAYLGASFHGRNLTADAAEVSGDEDGWHLTIDSNDGRYDFRIHSIAWDFAEHVDATIGDERRFAESCRGGPGPITKEDLEAYAPGDPKRIALEDQMRRQ